MRLNRRDREVARNHVACGSIRISPRTLAAGLSGSVAVTFMVAGEPSLTGLLLEPTVNTGRERRREEQGCRSRSLS
jgi:hypothetical protein